MEEAGQEDNGNVLARVQEDHRVPEVEVPSEEEDALRPRNGKANRDL